MDDVWMGKWRRLVHIHRWYPLSAGRYGCKNPTCHAIGRDRTLTLRTRT